MPALILATAALALPVVRGAETTPQKTYAVGTATCDGFVRLQIGMAKGFCAGLVVGPADGKFEQRLMRTPRMLLPLADGHRWLVTDLGGWSAGQGAIWLLDVEKSRAVRLVPILTGLTMPHTIALGPDQRIYVGEMGRIFRFDPLAKDPAGTIQAVVSGLPDNKLHYNRHPLTHFLFDENGDLLVNVGAPTDHCVLHSGLSKVQRCAVAEGEEAKAVIRRYEYLGDGAWASTHKVLARGLRNSLVLIRHESGTLLQGENSYDVPPLDDRPYDEINLIRQGANYGWPYCADLDQRTAAWVNSKAFDCNSDAHSKPVALLPPHSSPLGATYYNGTMFAGLRGKLLMSLHGYRPAGSRLVAFDVDSHGIPNRVPDARYAVYEGGRVTMRKFDGPAAQPFVLTERWDLIPGVRPAGAPVGISIAPDGAVWVADDRNGAIVRIAVDRP